MPRDERQHLLELTSESEVLSSDARNIEPPASERDAVESLLTVANNDFCHGLRQLPSQIDTKGEIRVRRESIGLSQRQLAKQLAVSQTTLSRAESGTACIPDVLRKWLSAS
jgi:DNA-binding XRE family transcriptional regulator